MEQISGLQCRCLHTLNVPSGLHFRRSAIILRWQSASLAVAIRVSHLAGYTFQSWTSRCCDSVILDSSWDRDVQLSTAEGHDWGQMEIIPSTLQPRAFESRWNYSSWVEERLTFPSMAKSLCLTAISSSPSTDLAPNTETRYCRIPPMVSSHAYRWLPSNSPSSHTPWWPTSCMKLHSAASHRQHASSGA